MNPAEKQQQQNFVEDFTEWKYYTSFLEKLQNKGCKKSVSGCTSKLSFKRKDPVSKGDEANITWLHGEVVCPWLRKKKKCANCYL